MPLILPNDIANEQLADGNKLQQNYTTIEDWLNTETILRDGSVAMTNQLLLPGTAPTQPNQAANKKYVDDTVAASQAAPWTALPLVNGWVPYSPGTWTVPAVRKLGDIVYLRGTAACPTVQGGIAQLPAGYKPPLNQMFTTWASWNNTAGRSAIRLTVGADGYISFDSYSFPTGVTNPNASVFDHVSFDGINFSVTP